MEEMIAFLKEIIDQIDKKTKELEIENVAISVNYNNGYGIDDIQCLDSSPTVKPDEYKPHWRFYQYRRHGGPWADKTDRMNAPNDD